MMGVNTDEMDPQPSAPPDNISGAPSVTQTDQRSDPSTFNVYNDRTFKTQVHRDVAILPGLAPRDGDARSRVTSCSPWS